ncbi:potassium transporter KtrB [Dorea acetigenes]|uniref:Potassium transporter KtrB n=1 Tax=Dorea acetigenes TaxID=2981787 RepID=A0ABT2RLD3_9FIRM|nr:potassium transporter TrkG [Dorea acetigenes]MCB6414318.1 potassium transporter KtrB [Faecalimonas umbilicata]MCU6686227.1 potassium transporter KtrB [Dorea acetigenes]
MKKRNIRWNTMQILALGFMGVILAGGVLLSLPFCNRQPITFSDALFTSTTAVCVTGLVTVTPAVQFTLAGQIILLILIQIGGLGIIACAVGFLLLLRRQITVKERIVIQETYNMEAPGGMVAMILRVIKGTLAVETAGAVLYAFRFIPEFGVLRGIWYAVFHAVSAFCNAGIDILGDTSFQKYVGDPIINITTVLLIIVSGIGFSVWQDLISNGRRIRRREIPNKWWFTRLRLHSKLAIVTTLILLIGGTVCIFLMERNNPATLGNLSTGEKWMAAFFHSTSTRTAGFATVSQSGLYTQSKFLSCILMFIGGSPGGTAGGVKTTTVAMVVLTCLSVFRGGEQVECFGRRLSGKNIRMGFAVIMTAVTVLFAGTIAITVFEPQVPFIDILYEAFSAVGTVGLTADLTPTLSSASHMVLIVMMYIGRIGPISLALLFGGMSKPKERARELPEQRIMVG